MLAPLRRGDTLLGRGNNCDIVVPSEKASRAHAKITVGRSGVHIEDLNSTNGVFVNDTPIESRTRLNVRDTIRIGDSTMRLVHFDDAKRTRRGDPIPGHVFETADRSTLRRDVDRATKQAHSLDVVGPLVEKMLTLGRTDEAERLLRSTVQRLLAVAEQGGQIEEEVTSSAAVYAVRLAEATKTAHWIDQVIRLHAALGRTLPLSVVDDLYRILRVVRGIDYPMLRHYIERLESGADAMAPTERFALKRIAGLCRIAEG